jgi:hypothetical protein
MQSKLQPGQPTFKTSQGIAQGMSCEIGKHAKSRDQRYERPSRRHCFEVFLQARLLIWGCVFCDFSGAVTRGAQATTRKPATPGPAQPAPANQGRARSRDKLHRPGQPEELRPRAMKPHPNVRVTVPRLVSRTRRVLVPRQARGPALAGPPVRRSSPRPALPSPPGARLPTRRSSPRPVLIPHPLVEGRVPGRPLAGRRRQTT